MERHTYFKHRNEDLPAVYVRTDIISPGVTCEVYLDPTTGKRDYGKVTVEPGYKTPKQKVLSGEETIECYFSGKGRLTIIHTDGTTSTFDLDSKDRGFAHEVRVGEIMQWEASNDEALVFVEICYPPFTDGRFENIDE